MTNLAPQNEQLLAQAVRDADLLRAQQTAEAMKVILSASDLAKKTIEKNENESKKATRGSDLLYKQISLATGVCGLVGVVIMGYLFIANPTRDNDTALQLQEERISAQRATIDELTKVQQNDTQEVKGAIKDMILQIQQQSEDIVQLSTIINERIPQVKK